MNLKNYITILTLLICHQIDAAYWKEWEMFDLPGGIQFFIIFNLIVFPPLLFGLRDIILKTNRRKLYSVLISSLGIMTFSIHFSFFLLGHSQFTLPVSIFLILSLGLVSIYQLLRIIKKKI